MPFVKHAKQQNSSAFTPQPFGPPLIPCVRGDRGSFASVPLHLRYYDMHYLMGLLRARGFDASQDLDELKGRTYRREQGRAAEHRWWRDKRAFIPRALLVLCAETADVEIAPLVPVAPPTPPAWMTQREANAWAARLPRAKPHHDMTQAYAGFTPRDGSKYEPAGMLEVVGLPEGELYVRTLRNTAWLPVVIKDRLTEAGRCFAEPRGRYAPRKNPAVEPFNRSAGLRRLIEVHRTRHWQTNRNAPAVFRGVMLSDPHTWPQPENAARDTEHLARQRLHGWEAFQRLCPDDVRSADQIRIASAELAFIEKHGLVPASDAELIRRAMIPPSALPPARVPQGTVNAPSKTPARPKRKPVRAADIENSAAFSQERLACPIDSAPPTLTSAPSTRCDPPSTTSTGSLTDP